MRSILVLSLVVYVNAYAHGDEVDFVVVGGGVGGCTVASRLSESGKNSVLLLEAGGMPDPGLEIPILSSILLTEPQHDNVRRYVTVRNQNAGLDNGGLIPHAAGVGLGGGSAINAMIFNRGSPHDFNNWARLIGDLSWNYTNMLPYFKKVEDYHGDWPSNRHGSGGQITVSKPKWAPGLDVFLAAGQEKGYPLSDPNGPQQISVNGIEFSKRNGRRVSSYIGYIKPFMESRRNLQVRINSRVSRIIFNGNRAVGVKFATNSSGDVMERIVWARKEVVISAGVFETPALLMRSGIGPKAVLNQAKVPVIKDLPVGRNLQDHVFSRIDFIINSSSAVFIRERDLTPENFRLWEETGEGPYSAWHGQTGQAFLQTKLGQRDRYPGWADIQVVTFNSAGIPILNPVQEGITLAPGEVITTTGFALGRPKTKGFITLNTTDIDGPPVIDFQYFARSQDLDAMVEGLKIIIDLHENASVYKKLGIRLPYEPLPSCKHLPYRSDDYWKCFIKARTGTWLHGCGTSKMGRGPEDRTAVVDTKLRVIGTEGLRIVDNSIVPVITNSNPQAVVYAIAEKAADMMISNGS